MLREDDLILLIGEVSHTKMKRHFFLKSFSVGINFRYPNMTFKDGPVLKELHIHNGHRPIKYVFQWRGKS